MKIFQNMNSNWIIKYISNVFHCCWPVNWYEINIKIEISSSNNTTFIFSFHIDKNNNLDSLRQITIEEQLYIGELSVSLKEFLRFFKTFGFCTFHLLSCWEIQSSEKISQEKKLSLNFWKKKCISFIGAAEEEMKEMYDTMIYKKKIVNCSIYVCIKQS